MLRIATICLGVLLAGGLFVGNAVAEPGVTVIPRPTIMEMHDGAFVITSKTAIHADDAFRPTGEFLAERLAAATPCKRDLKPLVAQSTPKDAIVLRRVPADDELGEEGYRLEVSANGVLIEAATPAGAFYGCQTVRQLLPPEIEAANPVQGVTWSIPNLHIVDRPRFSWRGMMLDSSRHFQDKETVKRFIDLLAYTK